MPYLNRTGKPSAWEMQRRVVGALVYRELKTRVSEVRFGVVGVFIEPVGVVAVFVLLFGFLHHHPVGINPQLFLVPGAVCFAMFVEITVRSLNAMRANEALFFYKPVKPIDAVIARSLVETGLYSIVCLAILAFLYLFQEHVTMDDFPLFAISFLALSLASFGLGLISMVVGFLNPSAHQLLPILLRPLWIISGAFFSAAALPQWLRPLICLNPILQAVELNRRAIASDYPLPDEISLPYLLLFASLSCIIGLYAYHENERKLLTR